MNLYQIKFNKRNDRNLEKCKVKNWIKWSDYFILAKTSKLNFTYHQILIIAD